ncbi:hypothetical protein [Ascidiimonas sp. W6]|uniref:hypothetical protein n=1 Tax=Ascidiimonas meishanensis TaxID=3128903 RepID=UPI0030EDD901
MKKPWDHLIANGDAPPTLDEQNVAKAKGRKNNSEGKKRSEGLTTREKWALSLHGSEKSQKLRRALKADKATTKTAMTDGLHTALSEASSASKKNGTNLKSKKSTSNQKEQPERKESLPTIEEQKNANDKVNKNYREKRPLYSDMSAREQFAFKTYREALETRWKMAGSHTASENASVQKSKDDFSITLEDLEELIQSDLPEELEGLEQMMVEFDANTATTKTAMTDGLHTALSEASSASKKNGTNLKSKKSTSNQKEKPERKESLPTIEEQKNANDKVSKNYREKRPPFSDMSVREQLAFKTYSEALETRWKMAGSHTASENASGQKSKDDLSIVVNNLDANKGTTKTAETDGLHAALSNASKALRKKGTNLKNKKGKKSTSKGKEQPGSKEFSPTLKEQNKAKDKVNKNYREKRPPFSDMTAREQFAFKTYSEALETRWKMAGSHTASENASVQESKDDFSVTPEDLEELIQSDSTEEMEGLAQVMNQLDANELAVNTSITAAYNTNLEIAPDTLGILTDPKFVDETEELQQDIDKTARAVAGVARIPAPDDSFGLGGFMNAQPTETATAKGLKRTRSDESAGSTNSLDKKPAARKRPNRGSK